MTQCYSRMPNNTYTIPGRPPTFREIERAACSARLDNCEGTKIHAVKQTERNESCTLCKFSPSPISKGTHTLLLNLSRREQKRMFTRELILSLRHCKLKRLGVR